MGHRLNVFVIDSDGEPVTGRKVTVDIEGVWKGGTLDQYTDEDGHAEFETAANYESYRQLTIYVGGQSFGPYEISGGSYTVQLD
jgi:hypothetical protein